MLTLTKSLHTVTAVVNVARLIQGSRDSGCATYSADTLARHALATLGYDIADFAADDPTVCACIKAIRKAGFAGVARSVSPDVSRASSLSTFL